MLIKFDYNILKKKNFKHFICLGSIYSGILIGLNAPGFGTQWLGLIAFIPLNLNLEKIHSKEYLPLWKRALLFFSHCWLTGIISSLIGGYWITNSIHLFGHLSLIVSIIITGIGYGLEVGFQLFVYFGIPLLLIRKLNNWDLPVRFLYVIAIDPFYPKLIQWNYGGLTFSEFPYIEQLADLIGSSGLIIYTVGLTFLFLGWYRFFNFKKTNHKNLFKATIIYILFWLIGLSYGNLRLYGLGNKISEKSSNDSDLEILLVQPNFSLSDLASNPDLTYSKRKYNLESLLMDSRNGLEKFSKKTGIKKLLVWPESVFPEPFFKNIESQQKVISFAKDYQTHILFTTIDWKINTNGKKFFGVSVLVDNNGEILGKYNKIFLIPFGETIPFSSWFPKLASWLRKYISNMSEFESGKEYKVFSLSDSLRFSAPICFDIFAPVVIRKMVRNDSNLIINLSNLAWFGKTNASDNMIAVLRWRAIENRVPVVFASNNGKSVFIGANGKNLTKQLDLFEEETLFSKLSIKRHFSFFREYAEWVWGTNIIIFLFFINLAYRRGNIFK